MTTTYINVGPDEPVVVRRRTSPMDDVVYLKFGDDVTVAIYPEQWERLRAQDGDES